MQSRGSWLAGICAAALLTATSAWAQQSDPTVTQPQNQPAATQQQDQPTVTPRQTTPEGTVRQKHHGDLASAGLFKASDLMNLEVKGKNNEDLGEIEDVVFDAKTGKIRYAAISMGGFLGIGDKLVAVDWNSLQLMRRGQGDDAEYFATLDINKERMQTAQGFDDDHWPTSSDQIWMTGAERDADQNVDRDVDVDIDVQRDRPNQPTQPDFESDIED
jgi:sporulation protein YlmC with PRC-barrel domain